MRTHQLKQQRRRIITLNKKWRYALTMDEWNITHRYVDGSITVNDVVNHEAIAAANVRWEYRQATISWNLREVAKLNDVELQEVFLHEAMHVLLNEMREVVEGNIKAEERSATTFSFLILRVLEMRP